MSINSEQFKDEIYKETFVVKIYSSEEELIEVINEIGPDKYQFLDGFTTEGENIEIHLAKFDIGTITYECYRAFERVFQRRDVKLFEEKSNTHAAYYMAYITENVCDIVERLQPPTLSKDGPVCGTTRFAADNASDNPEVIPYRTSITGEVYAQEDPRLEYVEEFEHKNLKDLFYNKLNELQACKLNNVEILWPDICTIIFKLPRESMNIAIGASFVKTSSQNPELFKTYKSE